MRRARRRAAGLFFLTAGAALSMAAAAAGPPVRLAWSTYMRSGPGAHFMLLDEIEHDHPVQVGGCKDGWCRVLYEGAAGYIDQDALALPRVPAAEPVKPGAACFVAGQEDYRRKIPTRFCAKPPGG